MSDGTRSLGYAYDANGNLTTFTDATAKATTFQYDLPRITQPVYPANPTTASANVYDALGRCRPDERQRQALHLLLRGPRQETGPD